MCKRMMYGVAVLMLCLAPMNLVYGSYPDLLARWTCDEGEGAVVSDVSGNGRDGVFVNGDPNWVEGASGSAVELIGPTLIEVPPLDMELTEATMAGWILPYGAQPDWSSIIMTRDPGLATGFNVLGYQLAYHWNDTSESWSYRGGDMIAEDDWTFAAVTIEPDKATFYVNGVKGSVNEITHEPCVWDSNIYLGGDGTESWVSRRMVGALDDVSMYSRALTAKEILDIMGVDPVDPGTDGLAAYYALDGNTDDSSGNELHGTLVGDANYVDGAADMAMEFYGDSYVECSNDPILDINGPISISLWIRPDANDPEGQGTTTAPMAKAMSGIGWSWQVRYGWNSPQPYMAFTFNTSPRAWAYVGQNLERFEWAHIACSHDGETLTCFLNGVETESTPMGAITNSDAPVLIGSDGWRCDWIGAIDEVAIYDRGLSDAEIRYLSGDRVPVDPGIENLVAYYPLDGDANDVSANANHGTLAGEPQWVLGAIGEALEFDGVDDHVDCGNDPSLDITGPITIGAWVYPIGPGSTNYPRIVDKSDGTGGADPGYKLYLRSAQDYLVTLSAGGEYINSTISAVVGDWNYVAFVTDETQRKLFLNGVWEVWDVSALPVSSSNPLYIGDGPAGSRPLNGIVDEVTIYNRALSVPEVHFIAGER